MAYLAVPAYGVPAERRDRCLANARRLAAAAGCALAASPLLGEDANGWIPAAARRADLARAAGADLVIAARGGYGCLHLIDAAGGLPPVVGFSDLTAFHAARWVAGRRDGVHGTMPGVDHGERALATTCALLAGTTVTGAGADVLRPGRAAGPCFPACLRVLAGLCGTPFQPDLAGCVAALEDIDEKPYQIDRDLEQLARAGVFAGIAGLIFGEFPCAAAIGPGPSHRDIAAAWAERLAVPAVFAAPIGHHPDPIALPVGGRIALAAGPEGWTMTATGTRSI